MATPTCWKCLLRPSTANTFNGRIVPLVSSFSTTATVALPAPAKKKPAQNARAPTKAAKTLRIKKKTVVKAGRPPAPGERKAIRKRIVLSNSNALEVLGLTDMTPKLDAAQVGKVHALPDAVVDKLRAVEAFKTTQGWSLFRKPAMLVRDKSVELANSMLTAAEAKKTKTMVIDGTRGAGKSMMLLQAMSTAFQNGWIVLNIPEAQELTMAMTDYAPVPDSKPLQYTQNVYTAAWLAQIAKANQDVLSKLELSQQHTLPIPLQSNISLARLAELGARDADIAWPVFQAFWSEITAEGRPPVLMTLDGLHHVMRETAYRSPEFEIVHAHDLVIIKHFVDYLSGAKSLPNGGAVIAATTTGNNPISYTTDLALKQKAERQASKEVTKADPYAKLDARAYESLQKAELMHLTGLSKAEARGLMEYWAASGILRQQVDERTVAEKWALAGNGIVGEIERGVTRVMRI